MIVNIVVVIGWMFCVFLIFDGFVIVILNVGFMVLIGVGFGVFSLVVGV